MKTWLLVSLLLLTACAARTSYELVPPTTEEGRACVGQCLNGLQACEDACKDEKLSCDMLSLSSRVFSPSNMFHENECSDELCMDRCADKHRICYSGCGGQVLKNQSY